MASLTDKLTKAHPTFRVVAMPDFYLDYILRPPGTFEDLTRALEIVANRGGGNIVGWKHVVGRGGNSPNLVAQLAKLGVEVVPIIETDEIGFEVLRRSLRSVDLSHVKTTGSMASTVSLETEYSGRRVNIMVSNPASHARFGPEKLSQSDKELIRQSDFVVVLNWAQNQRGTDLAEEVFKIARQSHAVTFFDPGDLTVRSRDLRDLIERILASDLLDILSVNENELTQLSSTLSEHNETNRDGSFSNAAGTLSMFGCRVDLHTPEFSASFQDGKSEKVPCLKIDPVKVTGAGDVWNAASIFAQGMNLEPNERLVFANAAAASYLGREDLNPPGLEEILDTAEKLEKSIQD
jgi:ribokinase